MKNNELKIIRKSGHAEGKIREQVIPKPVLPIELSKSTNELNAERFNAFDLSAHEEADEWDDNEELSDQVFKREYAEDDDDDNVKPLPYPPGFGRECSDCE